MKKIAIALGIVAVLGFIAYKAFFSAPRFVSVLVFSKTEQFRHESIEAGKTALLALGKAHGFRVDTTEDASVFKEKTLQEYNVVVFLNTTGNILNDAQQLEFNRFIQAGGGFVGIHAAADTEYDWPWYGKMVGAYFKDHPVDPNVREADIDVLETDHESTSMLPIRWHSKDEWYNFKDINPEINVLMNLDETSYEGGNNGKNHPIAWYHEYDGGRAWYTGKGHTVEVFSEPLFMEHVLGGIQYAAGEGKPVDFNNANVAPEENRFEKIVLTDHLNEPMELEMLPDGKLIYIQRDGEIHVYDPAIDSTLLIQKLEVFSELEDGLLGMALDPDFKDNNWIYLFYSDPEKSHQNIARFEMGSDYLSIDLTSEKVLLEVPTQREECCHSAGSLEFGPGGLLYISTGDNTNPHASDGYAPTDEQAGRSPWDAQKSSANTKDLRGKILRIQPKADGTYAIPAGNLFKNEADGLPEIYVMGCRNPFRIAIDQHTGYLYWGDVGPDAGKDTTTRGPKGYDEVNQAREAGFFGWPYFIADNKPYKKYDFATQVSNEARTVKKPVNQSPNNTGAVNLPPAQPAFVFYPYGPSQEFPEVGESARNAMAGPVFYLDDYPENELRYPEYYDGKLFIYDWMRGWIMAVTMDEKGDLQRMERFLPSFEFNNPTDMIFGPNGDLYLLEYGTIWFAENPDARLVHLKYNSGNRKPIAKIDFDKNIGKAPMEVQFSAEQSKDFDGDDLIYEWYFGSDEVGSNEISPGLTFEEPGEYEVVLIVKDPSGEQSEAKVDVFVGNALPKLNWEFSGNQTFYWDNQSINYKVVVADEEDGTIGQGIDPKQVNISMDYLERGYDANESALGHKALQEASAFALGKQLMDQSDCKTCHQIDVASVGPHYLEIAQKYKGDTKAEDFLTNKIIQGGGGVWGETVMAAHPQLSDSEARQMTKYILSLDADPNALVAIPTSGSYAFDQHNINNQEGKYILTASYTDKGGKVIGPLTARETYVFRNPILLAGEFDDIKKAQKFKVDPEMTQGMFDQEFEIVIGNNEGKVRYDQIDFTDVKGLQLNLAKAGSFFKGGTVALYLDEVAGEPWLAIPIKSNLLDFGMEELKVNIPATAGVHDLYVTFSNDGEKPVTALIAIYFSNQVLEESI